VLLDVLTPLGFRVRATAAYWKFLVEVKHPVMTGCETEVSKTLATPDEIRQSRRDPAVFLFYRARRAGRWACAVAKRVNGEGFLVTAYPTDAIKEGDRVWPK
jgi:hypothetical protein